MVQLPAEGCMLTVLSQAACAGAMRGSASCRRWPHTACLPCSSDAWPHAPQHQVHITPQDWSSQGQLPARVSRAGTAFIAGKLSLQAAACFCRADRGLTARASVSRGSSAATRTCLTWYDSSCAAGAAVRLTADLEDLEPWVGAAVGGCPEHPLALWLCTWTPRMHAALAVLGCAAAGSAVRGGGGGAGGAARPVNHVGPTQGTNCTRAGRTQQAVGPAAACTPIRRQCSSARRGRHLACTVQGVLQHAQLEGHACPPKTGPAPALGVPPAGPAALSRGGPHLQHCGSKDRHWGRAHASASSCSSCASSRTK